MASLLYILIFAPTANQVGFGHGCPFKWIAPPEAFTVRQDDEGEVQRWNLEIQSGVGVLPPPRVPDERMAFLFLDDRKDVFSVINSTSAPAASSRLLGAHAKG